MCSENGVAKNVHYGDVLIKFGEYLDVSKEALPMIADSSVVAKYKASFLKNGDVIVADTAEDETVGKCSEIACLQDEVVISGLHTIPYRPLLDFASGYLGYYMNSDSYHNQLLPLMQGIKVTSVSKSAMQDTILRYPKSTDEQAQISAYFRNLNHLITLHQRMCVFLGSMVRIRMDSPLAFAWEQRKLGEISDKVTEKNAGLQYVETLTNSAEFGVISQRDFFDHSISKIDSLDGYYIVRSEDFVYNPRISVTAPVGPVNRNKLGRNGVMSPLYTVFRPHDVDNTYLEHFFKSRYWHSYMNFNGDSGARSDRFSIKDELFFQMPIPTPHIEEQQKIGAFLTSLDDLITLHQREPKHIKNNK